MFRSTISLLFIIAAAGSFGCGDLLSNDPPNAPTQTTDGGSEAGASPTCVGGGQTLRDGFEGDWAAPSDVWTGKVASGAASPDAVPEQHHEGAKSLRLQVPSSAATSWVERTFALTTAADCSLRIESWMFATDASANMSVLRIVRNNAPTINLRYDAVANRLNVSAGSADSAGIEFPLNTWTRVTIELRGTSLRLNDTTLTVTQGAPASVALGIAEAAKASILFVDDVTIE